MSQCIQRLFAGHEPSTFLKPLPAKHRRILASELSGLSIRLHLYSPIARRYTPERSFRSKTGSFNSPSEHDKLLSAFSSAQNRFSALERKHDVSDTEIITLTEEKLRLQAQVTELERDVEELVRSREELRQIAVHEGSQYVEIVKMASRLEEIAGEERKAWKRTLSQYVGTEADTEDLQTEQIDQNEAGSSVRRQRRKLRGGLSIDTHDILPVGSSPPKVNWLAETGKTIPGAN